MTSLSGFNNKTKSLSGIESATLDNATVTNLDITSLSASSAEIDSLDTSTVTTQNLFVSNLTNTQDLNVGQTLVVNELQLNGNVTQTGSGNIDFKEITSTRIYGEIMTPTQEQITSVGTLQYLDVDGGINCDTMVGTVITQAQPNITSVGTLGSLDVSGGVTASTLTGTLQTATQPNITTVGTLGSLTVSNNITQSGGTASLKSVTADNLNVSGNLTVDTNTLFVNSALNRVGIGTSSINYTLDVAGGINVQTGSVYRIGGGIVLSSTTLGSGVVNSSLTTVGNLNSLVVAGNITQTTGTASLRALTIPSMTCSGNLVQSAGTASLQALTVPSITCSGNISQSSGTASLQALTIPSLACSGNITQTAGTCSLKTISCGDVTATASTISAFRFTGQEVDITPTFSGADGVMVNDGGIRVDTTYKVLTSIVLTLDTLGSTVIYSSLQTLGTLTGLVCQGVARFFSSILNTTVLNQGLNLVWNFGGVGETDLINKSGTGTGGFRFYNSTGNASTFSTGQALMTSVVPTTAGADIQIHTGSVDKTSVGNLYIGNSTSTDNDASYVRWNKDATNSNLEMGVVGNTQHFQIYRNTGTRGLVGIGKTPIFGSHLDVNGYFYAYKIAFKFWRAGGWSVVDGESVLKSGNVSLDRNNTGMGGYNGTLGRYIAPVSGVYRFSIYVRGGDGAGATGLKPNHNGVNAIANADGSYWMPNDGGNRRTMTWTETCFMTVGTYYTCLASQAMTVSDFVFSGEFIGY